jgi:hypothetical protein
MEQLPAFMEAYLFIEAVYHIPLGGSISFVIFVVLLLLLLSLSSELSELKILILSLRLWSTSMACFGEALMN